MNANKIKKNIIRRIIEINDVELLKSIEGLFNTSDKNISNILSIGNEKLQQEIVDEKEDFTSYIKEWVKNM